MNLLDFANPVGWWWGLLAVPIVVLYVLKLRVRRQPVPTLLFWDRLFDEKRPRSWWQKLRQLFSLLLQLAFLALLVTALVDPLWSWQRQRQRRIVLVMDNSASMRALEADGQSRLEMAKAAASALVRSLRGRDRMAIVTAGGPPRVIIGMTDHQRTLLSAIERLPTTDGPTNIATCVELANRLLAEHDAETDRGAREEETDFMRETVVLSDGCFDGLPELAAREHVKLYGIGTPLDNVGITRYQVRRSLLDAVGYQVLLDVTNFSEEPLSCRVELNLEGELIDVIPLELEPGATETRILDHTTPKGGRLVATLDTEDPLEADNSAVAVLPARRRFPVVLVTEGNLFLKSVLEAIPLVDLRMTAELPDAAPGGGILVLDRKVPAQLPAGRILVIDPQEDCDAWKLGEPISQPIVASVDTESPLTQHVRLDNVLFPGARELTFDSDVEPLIQDPLDQPLLARVSRPGGDVIVLTCSLEKGDLPLRIAFPVLAKNAVEWFQGNSGELRPAISTGQIATLEVPATWPDPMVAGENSANDGAPFDDTDVTVEETEEKDDGVVAVAEDAKDVAIVEQSTDGAVQNLVLWSPLRRTTPITATNQQVTVGPLLETGLWTVRPAEREGVTQETTSSQQATNLSAANSPTSTSIRNGTDAESADADADRLLDVSIACNLANESESDLRPRGELESTDALPLLSVGGHSLWLYLTCLAAGLITAEWWLYQRRIVG